jgi:hypothetical protein
MHRGILSEKRGANDWNEREIMLYATTGKNQPSP